MMNSMSPKHSASERRRCAVLTRFQISKTYTDHKFSKKFKKLFFDRQPFPHFLFRNFVDNSSGIVEDLETKLQTFPNWERKENDLYSLYQTNDFKSLSTIEHPELYSFRQFLSREVRELLQNISGVELMNEVDVNGSCYSELDTLLPHNDLIDTRRFAFVYYLTPFVWEKKFGGQLVLFNSDNEKQPVSEAKEIYPARNSLMVFEVSEKSWHTVKEIMADSYPRLSINGWFHSTNCQFYSFPRPLTSPISLQQPLEKTRLPFETFLTSQYTNQSWVKEMQEKFGDTSECCMLKFLKDDVHKHMLNALKNSDFQMIGPLNKRKMFEIIFEKEQSRLKQFIDVFKSTAFLKYLSFVTGCRTEGCTISSTVSKIQHGCYTVAGDEDMEQLSDKKFSLETYLFVGEGEWNKSFGGRIAYIGNGDEEELVTFYPEGNSFVIVLRDSGAASFLKYVNSRCDIEVYMVCTRYYNVKIDGDDAETIFND